MTTKNMAYDHAAYLVRMQQMPAAQVAGASKVYDKFVAFTNMHVFSIGTTTVTAGTSTYTAWNGTATVTTTGTGDTLTGIKVSGTATSTYGPYALDNAAGAFRRIQISGTGVGSSTADGGVALLQGDQFWVQRGTDATAVQLPYVEYAIDPFANVSN
jgi:hypothetical protein